MEFCISMDILFNECFSANVCVRHSRQICLFVKRKDNKVWQLWCRGIAFCDAHYRNTCHGWVNDRRTTCLCVRERERLRTITTNSHNNKLASDDLVCQIAACSTIDWDCELDCCDCIARVPVHRFLLFSPCLSL